MGVLKTPPFSFNFHSTPFALSPWNNFLSRRYFLFAPDYFSPSAQREFITKFLIHVTNFVTHVSKFVIHVTKFVTKTTLYERKNYLADNENYLADSKNYLADSGARNGLCRAQPKISKKMPRKGAFYIDQLVDLCVKWLLQKAVHAPCSLYWLHKCGGL